MSEAEELEEGTEFTETDEQEEVELDGEETESEELEEAEEVPSWMSEDDEASDTMPVSAHVKKKNKLKGTIAEQKSEIQELKEQVQQLQTAPIATPTPEALQRPKRDDFDTDDEYDDAYDTYRDSKSEQRYASTSQQRQAQQAQEQTASKVTEHYDRAEKLVSEHSISPEVYSTADKSVREAVDAVVKGSGDIIVDQLISRMGEGSEKVLFYVGRNKAHLAELQSTLVTDPSGISAALMLGRIDTKIKGNKTKSSKAPKPAAQLAGGDTPGNSKASKKKYDAAHKGNKPQEAFNIKQAAKKEGVDTSKW